MVDRRLGAGLTKARKKTPPISDVDTLSMLVLTCEAAASRWIRPRYKQEV